ncbi:MAG: hypothetical protein AAGU05_13495 [Anaerolineaceae bacterium]
MNLVDQYVAEVGKHLYGKNRADIEQEIRSLIEDAVDDAVENGRARDEDVLVEILKKMGRPEDMAASYEKPKYLIGPRIFPFFWMVTRIVLAVLAVVLAVTMGIDLAQGAEAGQTLAEAIFESFAGLMGTLVAVFGNLVLVFAILERFVPEKNWLQEEEWDPRKLEVEPNPAEIKISEPIAAMVFTLLGFLVLNIYPHWLGIWGFVGGERIIVPILTPAFFSYLPFINAMMLVGMVQNVMMLQTRRWTTGLRWFEIAADIASMVLLGVMITGPDLVNINAAELARLGWEASAVKVFADFAPALATLFRMAMGIAFVVQGVEVIVHLYRLLLPKRPFKLPVAQ